MTQVEFYEAVMASVAALEASSASIEQTVILLYSLCFAQLVVALGACFYYLFWKRRR